MGFAVFDAIRAIGEAGSSAGSAGSTGSPFGVISGAYQTISGTFNAISSFLGGGTARRFDTKQTTELRERFYLTNEHVNSSLGFKDDTSGTITGTASSLIETPGDILKFLLVAYGKVTATDFYSGASTFGAVDRFNTLQDNLWRLHGAPNGYPDWSRDAVLRCYWNRRTSLEAALNDVLANIGGGILYRDDDGKWIMAQRQLEPATTDPEYYGQINYKSDVEGDSFRVRYGSFRRIVNRVNIKYAYDITTGKFTRTAFVDKDWANDGFDKPWGDIYEEGPPTMRDPRSYMYLAWDAMGRQPIRIANINASFVYEPSGAVALGYHQVAYGWRPIPIIEFEAHPKFYDAKPGMYFNFRDDTMPMDFPVHDVSTGSATPWADNLWMIRRRVGIGPDRNGTRWAFQLEMAPQTSGSVEGMMMGPRGRRALGVFPGAS